jgi:predicted Zn-dependent protease
MKKVILQFCVLLILFFGTWLVISRINWVSVFRVEQMKKSTEEKLGDLSWDIFSKATEEIHTGLVTQMVDTLIAKICKENNIDKTKIKIHVLKKDEINAFTLPNNHLVVFTGLITACDNEAQLMGVLSHEIAHMKKNHVMKKLVKDFGLSALISITSGNGGPLLVKKIISLLSSKAYERDLETEADRAAVDYMLKAKADPEQFANFLFKLGDENNLPGQLEWVSTHPDSKMRAESIVAYLKGKIILKETVMSEKEWAIMKEKLNDK